MLLLADIGNTRLKWASIKGSNFESGKQFTHLQQRVLDIIDSHWSGLEKPERVLISCVTETQVKSTIQGWVTQHWDMDAEFIVSQAQGNGVVNAYDKPKVLGSDRWIALVAVHQLYAASACVIDCGTALTLDVITKEGMHLGGLIVPGLDMMRRGLTNSTSDIKLVQGKWSTYHSLLGRDTEACVHNGCLQAAVGFIECTLTQMEQELDTVLQCVITGGNTESIMPLLSHPYHFEPDLVLKGLACMVDVVPRISSK